jgi:pilus assembly protein Flp/PilA
MTNVYTYAFVRLQNALASLRDREEGQAMVEYALILALVSIAAIVALGVLGGKVNSAFQTINNAFP